MIQEGQVYAFEPRNGEAFFVAETDADLEDRIGDEVGAEQCEGCGGSDYRIERSETVGVIEAVCIAVSVDTEADGLHEGCGARYVVMARDEGEVTF